MSDTWRNGLAEGLHEEQDATGKTIFKGSKNQKGEYNNNCWIGHKDFTVEGVFKDGVPQGNIKKIYRDGRAYEGAVDKNLVEEGQGTFTFVDGRKFQGPFSKGLANGEGTFTSDLGKSSKQTWKNGRRA